VSNGLYTLNSTLNIANGSRVQSTNGAALTVIDGNDAVRCVSISHAGAILDGFTVQRGRSDHAASIYISGGTVQNCVIANNTSTNTTGTTGGGACFLGSGGSINNCTIISNKHTGGTSSAIGGGVRLYVSGTISNCTIRDNSSYYSGGVDTYGGGLVVNCTIASNSATEGGGIRMSGGLGTFINCTINGNSAYRGGGMHSYYQAGSLYQNCLFLNNYATNNGGGIYNPGGGNFKNCTVASNNCGGRGGGGVYIQHASGPALVENTIIYHNTAGTAAYSNIYNYVGSGNPDAIYTNCCTAPTNMIQAGYNTACIESCPQFVAPQTADYHLTNTSPCVNAGINREWMANAVDLDGRRRLDGFNNMVDMGCYEHVPGGILFSVR